MYNAQETADRIKKMLIDKHLTGKKMCTDLGIGVNTMSNIRRGDVKSIETFALIAEYLNCSVDYLLGREETKNAAVLTVENSDTKKEQLIKNYELLNDEGQEDLLDYSEMLASNPRKIKGSNNSVQMNA